MSSPAIAQLRFINQLPLETLEAVHSAGSLSVGHLHPELAGYKVRVTGNTAIYVIDRAGYRRRIPFPYTFMNLFVDHAVFQGVLVSELVTEIAEGAPLDDGTVLVRGMASERIYILDRGQKRLITSKLIMDKYDFDEQSVVAVPQALIDAVPSGDIWE